MKWPILRRALSGQGSGRHGDRVPQSSGARRLKEWLPPMDGELVRRWKAAGLIILGKINTPLFNITCQPAMSVPLHWTPDVLPVGIQFARRFGD